MVLYKREYILYSFLVFWVIGSSFLLAWYTSWYYIRDAIYYIFIQGVSIALLLYGYRVKHIAMPLLYIGSYIVTVALFIYNFSLFSSVVPLYRTCLVLFLFFLSFCLLDMSIRSYIGGGVID